MSNRVYLLNGPNLNLLGLREPHLYGSKTLKDVEDLCRPVAARHGFELEFRQTNREYEMVDWIQEARQAAGLVINPAGFTYNAVPVLDAIKVCECPVVEVHISNIHKRAETEAPWRADSIMSAAATGVIAGLGVHGYALALEYIGQAMAAK
jgi:3-dehydroquinate dehydratase II